MELDPEAVFADLEVFAAKGAQRRRHDAFIAAKKVYLY